MQNAGRTIRAILRLSKHASEPAVPAGDELLAMQQLTIGNRHRPLFGFDCEFDDHRHMVGGLFPGADMTIDPRADQPIGSLRRKQEMVDPDTVILLPRAGLIIPE